MMASVEMVARFGGVVPKDVGRYELLGPGLYNTVRGSRYRVLDLCLEENSSVPVVVLPMVEVR